MAKLKALDLDKGLEQAAKAPVVLVAGADEGLRSRSMRLVLDAAAGSVRRFDAAAEARDVFDELKTVPLFGADGRRVVVIDLADAFLAANAEKIAAYVKKPSPTSMLVLCLSRPAGKDVRGALIVDCSAVTWAQAKAWAQKRAAEMGKKLTPRAADALVEAVGPNVLALENELDKLAAGAGAETAIAERLVEDLVPAARSRSVFELSNAVGRGDAGAALRLASRLLLSGEAPEGLIPILARQTRQLWQMKRLLAGGTSEPDLARKMGMPEFAVRRALQVLPEVTDGRLARQLEILSAADVELKTTSLRAGEEKVWLENLLARLCEKQR